MGEGSDAARPDTGATVPGAGREAVLPDTDAALVAALGALPSPVSATVLPRESRRSRRLPPWVPPRVVSGPARVGLFLRVGPLRRVGLFLRVGPFRRGSRVVLPVAVGTQAATPGGMTPGGPTAGGITPSGGVAGAGGARTGVVDAVVSAFRGPWRPRLRALLSGGVELLAGSWVFLVIGLVWWSNLPLVVGWHPRVVLTGSMMPSLRPGDVIVTAAVDEPSLLGPGRVAVVRDPGRAGGSYVHRVVRRESEGRLVTKGDANPSEDFPAVTPDRVMGEVRMVVPAVGLPAVWMRQGRFVPLIAVTVGTWLAVATMIKNGVAARGTWTRGAGRTVAWRRRSSWASPR